eukprot:TRINITY_DN8713_c0_g1_i1.p1 TRINITY_DN8713_c0_g1~~TRINITY_DN8713_c0_g1_i1.p1  ORF type:complete len:207 (-),score=48.53 TRINITY_DN8713_c0_g1_i1:86-706(-)
MDKVIVRSDKRFDEAKYFAVNTTSRSKENWSKELSPFFLGPIPMWGDIPPAANMENAWQYSKVYAHQVDDEGNPTEEWWKWMRAGIAQKKAVRFPMGRGAAPLYSYWEGEKMSYVQARVRIYAPLYANAVIETEAYKRLENLFNKHAGNLCLFDFDGYDHLKHKLTLREVLYNTKQKMGHGFVLAMLLQNQLEWESPFDDSQVISV